VAASRASSSEKVLYIVIYEATRYRETRPLTIQRTFLCTRPLTFENLGEVWLHEEQELDLLEAYAARIGDRVERSPPGVSKAGGVEGEVEAAGRLEGEDEAGGEEGEVEVEEKDLFFGERVPVGQQKTMLLPNKIEELRVEELSEMLKHIAFGTELRKPPYAPPPPPPPEISAPLSRTATFRTSASAFSAKSGGSGSESLTLKKVERQLIREGAVDALGAARGDHLGALFQVVMPDGRVRADWEYAIWEQYVAVNMTDVKRLFMSNRRFDLYGRPKESLFAPCVFEGAVIASEVPTGDLAVQVSTAHLVRLATNGEDIDSGDESEYSEAPLPEDDQDESQFDFQREHSRRPASALSSSSSSSSLSKKALEIVRSGTVLCPMDMETIEARVQAGGYEVIEALELDVMLVALNVLLKELPARNSMKDLCRPVGGEIPRLLAPVMPYVVTAKASGTLGVGLKAMAWIQLTWQACNYLGHLTRAEAVAAASPASMGATGRTHKSTAATRRSTAALKTATITAAAAAEAAQTASQRNRVLRPPSMIEYQVRIQPLPFPKPFKVASCACLDHKALGIVETDGIDLRELDAQDSNTNNAGALQAAAKRGEKLKGLTGRERQLALLELERGRYCTLMKLQPAHGTILKITLCILTFYSKCSSTDFCKFAADYEIKVRAFVTAPAVPGQKGAREQAFGTWSRIIRVRTHNAPPTAPQNVRFELNGLTSVSVYICWEQPALLHGGGLTDYQVRFRILAIGDVTMRSEGSGGAGGASLGVAGFKMSKKEATFYEALAFKYHGDRRLLQGGAVSGGLWALGHTLNPLLPATLLEVSVRAKNTEGWGDVSHAIATRTLSALPEEPQDVSAHVPRPQMDGQVGGDLGESQGRGAGGVSRGGGEVKKKHSFWMCVSVSWVPPPFSHSPLGILRYEVAITQWDPEQSPDTLSSGKQAQGQGKPHPMEPPVLGPLPIPRFPSESRIEVVEVREEEPEEQEEERVKKKFVYDLEHEWEAHCLVEVMRSEAEERRCKGKASDCDAQPETAVTKEKGSALMVHTTLPPEQQAAQDDLRKASAPHADAARTVPRPHSTDAAAAAAPPRTAVAAHGTETLTVRNLHPGAHVSVRVRAINEVGASEWTHAVVVKVPFRVPSRPLNLVLQAISEHRVQRQTQRHTVVAHWDPPQLLNGAPIVYYEVVYIAGGAVRMKRVSGSVTGVRLQGFAQAEAIEAKVIAVNGMGRSEPSSPRYTITHPGPAH